MATLEERVKALENLLSLTSGTDLYNSTHTGPEIDNAVTRALPGGGIDAAFATKASIAIQQTVEKTNVTNKSVTLDASELQAYLNGLPRLLTEHMDIIVSGTSNTSLSFANFYGSGSLRIRAETQGGCAFSAIYIASCNVPIQLWNLQITAAAGLAANTSVCKISQSCYVRFATCTITGHEKEANVRGIEVTEGGHALFEDCSLSSFDYPIFVSRESSATIRSAADTFIDNNNGVFVTRGGIVMLSGGVSDTLGGTANIHSGGMIVKADGTLI